MGAAKSKVKTRDEAVFGQRFEDLDYSTLKHILEIYDQKVYPRETKRHLFDRVRDLEAEVDDFDKRTIKRVLKRGGTLTRQALKDGKPKPKPCNICTLSYQPTKLYQSGGHSRCGYKGRFVCRQCIVKYIEDFMSKTSWEIIPCMFCRYPLPRSDVRPFISHDAYQKWIEFLKLNPIRSHPQFRWCQNPKCKHGQIHKTGAVHPKMTCNKCSSKSCYRHQIPWHENKTCYEYDQSVDDRHLKEEALSMQELRNSAARCPKCSAPAIKISGCGTVHCRCGSSYDWYKAMGRDSDGTLLRYERAGRQIAR